jgi:hypothetical protein
MRFPVTAVSRFVCAGLVSLVGARAATPAGTREGAKDYLEPPIHVVLGPEQLVAHGAGWPFLFQAQEGTTMVLGHHHWEKGKPEPVVFTTRSFDGRQTWEPLDVSAGMGSGPVTEGSVVQLPDGRILIFDVYAYHRGHKLFTGKRWVSKDGLRTLAGPESTRVILPQAKVDGMVDDRGEPISRLYLRRSVQRLPGGTLLATGYGRFEEDNVPVEYLPAMKQSRCYLLSSTDEGLTWEYRSTIAMPPMGQEGFGEPVLLRLTHAPHAGRLVCLMRTGRENAIYQTQSDDDGKTWAAPHGLSWAFGRFGRTRDIVGVDPDLTEMSDGTLVMGYGHKPDYRDNGNFVAFSFDQGVTWMEETRISTTMTRAYVGVREVSPGHLFVVYTKTDEPDRLAYGRAVFDTYGREVIVERKSITPTAGAAR